MNDKNETHIVTGAFGFSGKYITRHLLSEGIAVRTITNSYQRENPFNNKVEARPFDFDHPEKLVESLKGAKVLYNTYWVRFNHIHFNHSEAVENTLTLFNAAKEAGIERIIHTSITNPSVDSDLEYFHGKGILEEALIHSGMSYAILRPALLFGIHDVMINNIAWCVRYLPAFGIFGDGNYRLQPIFVDDYAKLCVEQGKSRDNVIIDAIGPETYSYKDFILKIAEILDKEIWLIHLSPKVGAVVSWIIGKLLRDVILTPNEIKGLMSDLLYTTSEPPSQTKFSEWALKNKAILGKRYSNEVRRRTNRLKDYSRL